MNSIWNRPVKFHAAVDAARLGQRQGFSSPAFEQLLYLRQPGYGTSYITGKLLVDRLMAEYAHQQELAGKPFNLREFMDHFNGLG